MPDITQTMDVTFVPFRREPAVHHTPWTGKDECQQARDVKQIDLVARRAKQRAGRSQPDRVNGTKSVMDLDRKHRYEHVANHGDADDCDKNAGDDREAAEYFERR